MNGPSISARRIGRSGQPIAIVEGFHPDPDGLRAAALATPFAPALHHYPGLRASLPADYMARVGPALATVLREVFGAPERIDLLDASFSIVTTPPDRLTLAQRLPHVDAVAAGRVALVHYLSPGGGDGTAFYRHRSTGLEMIDATLAPVYHRQLDAELRGAGEPPPGYLHGSTPLFERIAHVEARYNRAAIYRSALLHSGAIAPDAVLDPGPGIGRLTVTAFLATA